MPSTMIVRPSDVTIELNTIPLDDFPATGTYFSIAKRNADSTLVEGLKGGGKFIRSGSLAYDATLTIVSNSRTHAVMEAARKLAKIEDVIFSLVVSFNGVKYVSGTCDIGEVGAHELAGDSDTPITYTIPGLFSTVLISALQTPPVATAEQITALIPPG